MNTATLQIWRDRLLAAADEDGREDAEICRCAQVDRTTLSKVRAGYYKNTPRLDIAKKLCDALNITVDSLFEDVAYTTHTVNQGLLTSCLQLAEDAIAEADRSWPRDKISALAAAFYAQCILKDLAPTQLSAREIIVAFATLD